MRWQSNTIIQDQGSLIRTVMGLKFKLVTTKENIVPYRLRDRLLDRLFDRLLDRESRLRESDLDLRPRDRDREPDLDRDFDRDRLREPSSVILTSNFRPKTGLKTIN